MSSGVTVLGGPQAVKYGLVSPKHQATSLKHEYGEMTICVEVVDVSGSSNSSGGDGGWWW